MATVSIYKADGTATGTLELAPDVFDVPSNPAVLHQVVTAVLASRRVVVAHTKGRGDVRGGGRKPWAQKHTGRARHGSIRSPLWVGGGVTFGPRANRAYSQKVNVAVRRQALRVALSEKARDKRLLVLDDVAPMKTREVAALIGRLRGLATVERRSPSFLFALPAARRAAARGMRNIPRVAGIDVAHLNAVDVLQRDVLVMTADGVREASVRFAPRQRTARVSAPTRTPTRA